MMTINEVSKLTKVSVRTLHYYDEIGLLHPIMTTDAGYRLYDDTSLERLQQILLFKELEFSLKDIRKILDNPDFDRKKALAQQIELLTMKKEHIENMITFARQIYFAEGESMNFEVFDTKKIEEYKSQAKKAWGNCDAYREYEKKTADYSKEKQAFLAGEMMNLFKKIGENKTKSLADEEVQKLVKELQDFITKNYYTCTKEILKSLGQMYISNSEMTENIDNAGGKGTALFASKAIEEFCK